MMIKSIRLGNYEVSYKPNAVISSEGNILWIPPAIFKLTCVNLKIKEKSFISHLFNVLISIFRRSMSNIFLLVKKNQCFSFVNDVFFSFSLDQQTCELRFGSSGLSASQIRFGSK